MLPIVHAAAKAEVNWRLGYLGRSREAMSFLAELSEYGDRVTVHPSVTLGSMMLSGALDELVTTRLDDPDVYACGPERLLADMLERNGDLRSHRLHTDCTSSVSPARASNRRRATPPSLWRPPTAPRSKWRRTRQS